MITLFKNFKHSVIQIDYDKDFLSNNKGSIWINMVAPSPSELQEIAGITKIPLEFLSSSLDEEETAHIDIDDDNTLVVLDIPYKEINNKGHELYYTIPFSIIYNKEYMITVSTKSNDLVEFVLQKTKKLMITNYPNLTLHVMYRIASNFILCLKKIDLQTKTVEKKLHKSMQNKELFELMDLNKSLVFFSTALNANKIVISKLAKMYDYKDSDDDVELVEDLMIENNQAIEMCSIYRDILAGTMDAFASIISNNLNIVMKTLAVITIVLSIPTVIASLFGMNFNNVPLADQPWGFYVIVGVSFISAIIGGIFVIIYSRNIRNK